MIILFLFVFGLVVGSFLNVLALRFAEGQSILGLSIIGGRSRCMSCQVGLKWYELVPLFSFIAQGFKCRHCRHALNWQYPAVELITGVLTTAIPLMLYQHLGAQQISLQGGSLIPFYVVAGVWLVLTYTLITLSAIDVRLTIIPDQSNILIAACAITLVLFEIFSFGGLYYHSFSGPYGYLFGVIANPILNALAGAGFAAALFGAIILLTRGRGMGLGDLKLAIPLGILLGWPDALMAVISAFVIGSLCGVILITQKRATLKGLLPFGPFIAIGFFVAVFYAESILRWYFGLI